MLYLEGEPRFEVKFIRRAVEDDKNLQVVILQRTAEDKYLRTRRRQPRRAGRRLSRKHARSCSPTARMILGSVEAASFSPDQLRMLADFVSKRGGGLLMLGGRRRSPKGAGPERPLPKSCRSSSTPRSWGGPVLLAPVGPADPRRRDVSR